MKNFVNLTFAFILCQVAHASGLSTTGGGISKEADILIWIDSMEFINDIEYVNSEDFETIINYFGKKNIDVETDYRFLYIPENIDNSQKPETISIWDYEQKKSVYIVNEDTISIFN